MEFQKEEYEKYKYIDKQVLKENTRRNIHLDSENNPAYKQELFNFNTNINIQDHLEHFNKDNDYNLEIESKFNNNHDIYLNDNNMENYEINFFKGNFELMKNNNYEFNQNLEVMNTFQQTFEDPNLQLENFDCELYAINDIDYDLCLRK